ncbi:hypothetical protein [Pseudomonas sp. MS19]|uniref:hypothetical protein n=1 Tax=Pseudomonas sp. MS19 TaxID=2579939 RepID=UPI001562BF21|nr:hypothetical protein [Pseudomonas sp. MS19]NRH26049.1 hypothetical protein [Pseudomonas sp. MS19]
MYANKILWQEHALELHLCKSLGWQRVGMWRPLVVDISRHSVKEAMRPLLFKKILKRHIREQLEGVERCSGLPGGQRLIDGLRSADAFLSGRELSWEAFADKGRSLSNLPGHSSTSALVSLGQLMAMAPAINVFFEYAKAFPAPGFCTMCWRFVLSGEKYCRIHRVPVGGAVQQSQRDSDSYWFGRKLSPQFDEQLRRLSGHARREKLRSQWKAVTDIAPWLERYRPLVWRFVVGRTGIPEKASVLPSVIRALDEHSLEVGVLNEQRAVFHSSLLADRKAIFDLLLRAEAWLGAAAERRANWGGRRVGAGRPVKAVRSARQLV